MTTEVLNGLPRQKSSTNQGVANHHLGGARLELNAIGDGNCGFNAFILALYAMVRQSKLALNTADFNQFLTDFNSKLVNQYHIEGLAKGSKGQEAFLAVINQLQKRYPNSYLNIMQTAAAPILREMALTQQKKLEEQEKKEVIQRIKALNESQAKDDAPRSDRGETLLETTFLNAIAEGVYRKLHQLNLVNNAEDIGNQNDDFDGVDVIQAKIAEYTEAFVNSLLDNNNQGDGYTFASIQNHIIANDCDTLMDFWQKTGKQRYFEHYKKNGIYVSPRTLAPLANSFGIGLDCIKSGTKVISASDEKQEKMTLQNNNIHFVALIDDTEKNQALVVEYNSQKPNIPTQKNTLINTVDVKALLRHSALYNNTSVQKELETLLETTSKAKGDDCIFTKRGNNLSEQEQADFELAKQWQLEEIDTYIKTYKKSFK